MVKAYTFSKIYPLDGGGGTGGGGGRAYTAIVCEDGVIAAIGGEEILKDYPQAGVTRMDGKIAYPGFFDAHLHVLQYGIALGTCFVGDCADSGELIARLKEYANSGGLAPGRPVWARGFNETKFSDGVMPDRYMLDGVCADRPVIAVRACGHLAAANTAMLKKAGIERGGPVPGGYIDADENGVPNGIVRENALGMLYNALDELTVTEIKEAILRAQAALFSKGISAVCSDDISSLRDEGNYGLVMAAFGELAREGKLKLRVYEQARLLDAGMLKRFIGDGYRPHYNCGNFTVASLKIMADGSLGARTAYMREPYEDDAASRGIMVQPKEEIEELVAAAHEAGMPVAIHAIGDAAIDVALDAIDKAQKAQKARPSSGPGLVTGLDSGPSLVTGPETGPAPSNAPAISPRHAVVHCQITDAAQIARFAELGVLAMIQPVFVATDMLMAEARIGAKRLAASYNWKGFADAGVRYPCGSDCPVEDPDVLANIYCAVTRKTLAGEPAGGWMPEQRLSVGEALRGFTAEGAYACYAEDVLGSLAPGKYADMIVLDRDLFGIPADEIKDVAVESVIIGGETVYTKSS